MSSNDNIEARLQSQFSDTELDIATSAINQFSEQTGIEKIYFTGLALVFSVEIDQEVSPENLSSYFIGSMKKSDSVEMRAKGHLRELQYSQLGSLNFFHTDNFIYAVPEILIEQYGIITATDAKEKLQYMELTDTIKGERIRLSLDRRLAIDQPDGLVNIPHIHSVWCDVERERNWDRIETKEYEHGANAT